MASDVTVRSADLKYGRKPSQFPGVLRDLTYYAAGPLPKAPASTAPVYPHGSDDSTPWGMLGNDQYGDCGVAGLEHGFMAAAAYTGITETQTSTHGVVSYYMTYTGNKDEGVVLSDFLAYARQNGYYGKKVAAYAPVMVKDIPTLHFAIWAYDFCYTGIRVTGQMEEYFRNGTPWTLDVLDSPVVGGHCVPIVGYDSQYLYCVTWGQTQRIAYSAWNYIADEAWAVLTGEIEQHGANGHGVSFSALEADLSLLGAQ